MITGHPGTGKSVMLRLLSNRLSLIPEIKIGVLSRPQSSIADFYRELGELFEVDLFNDYNFKLDCELSQDGIPESFTVLFLQRVKILKKNLELLQFMEWI